LFQYLATIAPGKQLAWDCATGNGQAAVALADVFERVIATDASEKQIANAGAHPRVEYRVAPAGNSGIDSNSVDVVTVAQALHWFDLERFYAEARRVLKPEGVLAAWAYKLAQVEPAIDRVVNRYYTEVVGAYWPAERVLVENFENLAFPFPEIVAPPFEMAAEWNAEQLVGYLRTWSATQRFMAANQRDPLKDVEENLRSAWGDADQRRRVVWPLTVRMGRLL
jgi:SAM-dependent methyltransferase